MQAGGVGLFAAAVLWQLRDLKPVIKAVGETMTEVRATLAALLERERARAERLAAMEAQRAIAQQQRGGEAVDENWDTPVTGPIVEVRTPGRAATNTPRGGIPIGGGYSIKRPGGG